MKRLLLLLVILVLLVLLVGCTVGYKKCCDCGAAYKAVGGLPGQSPSICRNCGGSLYWCSEEDSGWDEERYQERGDELP